MADRTHEFMKYVQENILNDPTLSSASTVPSSSSVASSSSSIIYKNKKPDINGPQTKSAFIEAASDIAKGIQNTSKVLSKLTKLVRRQGLFDDPTDEINNFVYRIKEDLNELNSKCDAAQQYVDMNKSNSSFSSNHNASQASNHSLKIVGSLKTELMNATKDFKSVLEVRSTKIKDQEKRKLELTGNSALALAMNAASTPSKPPTGKHHNGSAAATPINGGSSTAVVPGNSQQMRHRHNTHLPSPYHDTPASPITSAVITFNPHIDLEGKSNGSSTNNGNYGNESHQQLLLAPPPASLQYYEAREQAIGEVEKTIHELGSLFKRLAGMIAEQQEMVERVDEDVENAISNADNAHTILTNMYDNASSNRGLYTKIIGILILFIIFFVLFLM